MLRQKEQNNQKGLANFSQENELMHHYSNDLHTAKIAVLGPIPPPLGGVSVHVQRVIARLKAQGCRVFHFDTCAEYRYRFFYLYLLHMILFLLLRRPEQVHLHTLYLSNGLRELELIVRLRRYLCYEIRLIEHDCRYLYYKDDIWRKRLNGLMPHIAKQVYIGDRTAQSFKDNGINPAQNTSIEAAFLPPDAAKEQGILSTYPEELFAFLNQHDKVLLANAFALSLLDGKDLYGFDLCIKLIKSLHEKKNNVGLVFVLGQIGNASYFDFCMQMITTYNVQKHIFVVTGQRELWPLMKLVDLFMRPTLSDGASVSVEEALWCGTPVVASDACRRPKDVFLFKAGDEQDLQKAVEKLLFSAQSSVISQGDAKINYVGNEGGNNASVDAAKRN